MADYFRPKTLTEALTIAQQHTCQVLAGGTDLYPADINATAWGQPGLAHQSAPATLDISALAELNGIRINRQDHTVELGALTTWTAAIESDLAAWFDGVRLAGREVGGRQIQNRGTLAGNLCNASPAADGVPALMALQAKVRLQSLTHQRELALHEFILGNRQTALQDDELLTAIVIPQPVANTHATFLKLGARRYLVISIAMVAMTVTVDDANIIQSIAIVIGACSAVAQRLSELEQRLLHRPLTDAWQQVRSTDLAVLSPIDDIRASADYRRHSALVLVRRGLQQLANGSIQHG